MIHLITRRKFLVGAAATGLVVTMAPGFVLAQARTEQRLVIIIQRGAMDGLAAVVPYGDPNYAALRGDLALTPDSVLKIDDKFGLHPALKPLYGLFQQKELAVIHAAASPYRERSHFDGQSVLELGSAGQPYALQSGWLNRVVAAINARDPQLGTAFGESVPMMMRGEVKVPSWAPSKLPGLNNDFMSLLKLSYAHDPRFADALASGLTLQAQTSDAVTQGTAVDKQKQLQTPQEFVAMCDVAGQWLGRPNGPRLATIELGGWDTHVQQGTEGGRLANNLDILARGIAQLKTSLGDNWKNTTVVTLTEFGRTARPNGNRGTDHGTASAMFLAGGRVQAGMHGDWPGLADANLYQNRDLMPSTDLRAAMKGVLNSLYGLSPAVLDNDIYPGSGEARQMGGLMRA